MDPIVIILLAIFIGFPVLSVIVMAVFAVSADFQFVEAKVRGGRMRGAVAAAVARVVVKDSQTIQLPLVVVLDKTGMFGRSTPLFGGATVRDIECRISMDGEHVSTVTEARSTHIGSFQDRVELPVNAELHLPQGVIRMYRDYRAKKRRSAEVALSVRGHVTVRHWWISREVPVRVTRYIVLGDPVPRLVAVRWRSVEGDADAWDKGRASVVVSNSYRDEALKGDVRFELRRKRRLLPDVLLTVHQERGVKISPKKKRTYDFEVDLETPGPEISVASVRVKDRHEQVPRLLPLDETDAGMPVPATEDEVEPGRVVSVVLRVYWDDHELEPEEVRVLGVPGASHGPPLRVRANGDGGKRKGRPVARLKRVDRSGVKSGEGRSKEASA